MKKQILQNNTFLVAIAEYAQFFPYIVEIVASLTDEEMQNFQKEKNLHIRNCKYIRLWILKKMLAQISGLNEKELNIKKAPQGKPFLLNSYLSFNLSTSKDFCAGIYHLNEPCGIDIEEIVPIPENQIPYFVFSENEIQDIHKIPSQIDYKALYTFWTCKEAYVKGTGDGIDQNLAELDFAIHNLEGEIEKEFIKEAWTILRLNYIKHLALAVSFKKQIEYRIDSYILMPQKSHSLELMFKKII